MNEIYLMRDEKRNYALFKVGFAKDLHSRTNAYTTHNPEVECIAHVKTKATSKHKVETMFHNEIKSRGYEFINASIDNKMTEWFKVDYNDEFYTELCEKGLNAFKCGEKRKDYGTFTTSRKKSRD